MRCWDSNSAARPDAKDLLVDVLDLRLDNEASTVQDDGVEVVRVTTTTGCKQLSSVLAEQGLRDVIPIVRENEVDIEAARLMDNEDWQEIGLDERAARTWSHLIGSSIRLKVHAEGELVELTVSTSRRSRRCSSSWRTKRGATSSGRGSSGILGRSWTAGRCSTRDTN